MLRAKDFFFTSGEVLFGKYGLEGTVAQRAFRAEVDWTCPLEFTELGWGDVRFAVWDSAGNGFTQQVHL